jgi:drug/metabolite transporter (DMT)-like permease
VDPGPAAFALGMGSAVTLALANTCVKAAGDILGARTLMALTSSILVMPFLLLVPPPGPATLLLLGLSLPAHWLYQMALVQALSRGDLSVVFPIMRGSAPLLTGLVAIVWLGEHLSPLALSGLIIASLATAVFAAPQKGPRGAQSGAVLWALATGVGIAVYNVIDAQGVRTALSETGTAWSFILWLFALDWIGITGLTLARRGLREYLASARRSLLLGIAAGVSSLASFSMALYGFTLTSVAYISAMRETAVVFAALMGVWLLREGFGVRRVLGALMLAAGLSLLQFG